MRPEVLETILKAINEVNRKVIYEAKIEGYEEGYKEGLEIARKEREKETTEKLIRKFKDKIDINELSETTGLSIEEIGKL